MKQIKERLKVKWKAMLGILKLEEKIARLEEQIARLEERIPRLEYDVTMPKYFYHAPFDYEVESHAPIYEASIFLEGELFPIPPASARPGYSPENDQFYLDWGKHDHDFIIQLIEKHYGIKENLEILDWGCSSGRVLRHFYEELKTLNWQLHGVDIQAFLVEWMRRNFPEEIDIMSVSAYPHLPFKDASLDVIYGISVFTHTKYLWDMWLAEFRRVLKPGGLCIQTIQCETAWKFYHENKEIDWVKKGHPQKMLEKPTIDEDFFLYGDALVSQTFYREEIIKKYWDRYMQVVDFLPPPKFSYQNWIILKNN